jgi:hypothetical protein
MRRVFSASVRGVLVVSVVVMMAVPAQAATVTPGEWVGRGKERIVKLLKRWTARTFGDGLSDPRP